jgi:hypothetical protein
MSDEEGAAAGSEPKEVFHDGVRLSLRNRDGHKSGMVFRKNVLLD